MGPKEMVVDERCGVPFARSEEVFRSNPSVVRGLVEEGRQNSSIIDSAFVKSSSFDREGRFSRVE